MSKLVLLRHGQSIWNLDNKFTGWMDIDLSDQGTGEAHQAGELLKGDGTPLIPLIHWFAHSNYVYHLTKQKTGGERPWLK